MKIQLDTENKTITIEESVLLHDFFEQINGILPGGVWREYTLQVTKITEWRDPITVPHTPTNPNPFNDPWMPIINPWTTPIGPNITYGDTTVDNPVIGITTTTSGIYNFEIT